MKSPEHWEEEDILGLIVNKVEESIDLDFKSAGSLGRTDGQKKEISKDVSAFANSAGGTIVYGIAESDNGPHCAETFTPLDPREISKEWLDQVINSTIHPRIDSLHINPVELKETSPGKYCYVVCIPESHTAHQASDKRYYKRSNFQSEPMEDYEIRQTMNRASRLAYQIELRASSISQQANQKEFRFQGILQNLSEIVGHEVSAVLFVPRDLISQPDDFLTSFMGVQYSRIAGEYVVSSHDTRTAVTSAHPLTPYAIYFRRSLTFRVDPPPAERFTAIVKVFDQFGLSLTATFHVSLPGCEIQLAEEKHAAKRSTSLLVGGQLV